MPAPRPDPPPHDTRTRLARLAWLLDNSIRIPGTDFRIGLDAIIGLIPGLGDFAGALLSSYIVGQAWRMGVPKSTLVRMGFNVLVEGVVGAVPLFGDIFDAAWKANHRNVQLLHAHLENPRRAVRASRSFVVLLLAALLLLLLGIGLAAYGLMRGLMALGASV
ncbi:MAG TPA: DUF4112 domain-containing protein [Burkholderiales bacterium]|nr:DUF4112 domain-containing protein [Burkholderiales bacterium]